jgi:hypothetical protein
MAWTGSEYGLVWEDTRLGPGDVYFARVDADGTVLLAQERITIDLGETRGPDIEWTGSEFGVAFADDRDAILEDEIWFVRLEADGTKIGSDVMVTTGTTGTWSMRPSLEWTGSTWGVGWTDDFMDFQFALFTPDGTMIHQETVSTESEMMDARPDIEWTGSEFATAWFNVGTGDNYMFARIGADGSKVGSDVVLATGMMGGPGLTVNLDWTGSEYGVFWTGFDEMTGTEHLVMTRVAGDGTILMAPTPLLVPDTDIILGMGFDLAFNGANFGFVSQQYVSTPTDGFDQVMLHMLVECD